MAFGVVTGRGQQVWDAAGRPVTDALSAQVAGPPVVVGPASADPGPAVAALDQLLHDRGADEGPGPDDADRVVAAGAGVVLAPGFVSARLHGARGDRRDAVLAAVRVLGLDGLHRLGERAGVLVALFGAEATKPLAAAASRAIAERRWTVLQLASAASGLLGAEQLVRLLTVDLPAIDPTPGAAASTMAAHLEQVLGAHSRARRLDLVLDLWQQVAAHQRHLERLRRRRATQGKQSRLRELTTRYQTHDDELLIEQIRAELGHEPSLIEAARWQPSAWQAAMCMRRMLADALATTALLRTAINVGDHGVVQGMNRSTAVLTAAARLMDSAEHGAAARRVPGLTGLPARPGCHARDLAAQLGNPSEPYVRQRLARAAEYAEIVMDVLTDRILDHPHLLGDWAAESMREWRTAVGYPGRRDPTRWAQPPVAGGRPTLAERLESRPGVPPAEEETAGDLLWYAELGDALAQLKGLDHAYVEYGPDYPHVICDPHPDFHPDPHSGDGQRLEPSLTSIPSALAGAAQLVSLGARPSRHCRTWPDLTAQLLADLAVTQTLVTAFQLPEPLHALDGTLLPGTRVRLEFARNARMLAEWSTYMGNCIASSPYVEAAQQGRSALAALRDESGRIVANVELEQHARGWRVSELRARFNGDPEADLYQRVLDWATTLPATFSDEPPGPPVPAPLPEPRPAARRRAGRTFQEVSGPLSRLAADAMSREETVNALRVLRTLHHRDPAPLPAGSTEARTGARAHTGVDARPGARTGARVRAGVRPGAGAAARIHAVDRTGGDTDGTGPVGEADAQAGPGAGAGAAPDVLTALRRLSSDRVERLCRDELPSVGLAELWRATAARPLEQALAALPHPTPAGTGGRSPLTLLLLDAPLPGSLRKLARHEAVAPARSMELVARRIRAAVGRLARAADPVLAHQVTRRADTAVLCALVVAVTSWTPHPGLPTVAVSEPGKTSVPGFPRTDLEDSAGPWQRALPGAVELGADLDAFWARVAAEGLRVPAAWLGHGGWSALWQRAAR
ncbi:hypothetical protein HCN51_57395 [Nonomuraea sp. FMUSA5-5]|uniref:Uncharacterized protein n=1 Tax=Nonomuraea composti TaxID=2720023 RepID=A0ABX1BSY4_9ACTN|nr:hypothetical protein [Nonomuraea sp. FMUSA5-5]NJP98896.1 hypothetical protein [Nonomuraea sp. FMUSA5-5]